MRKLKPGELVADVYEIVETLGSGAAADVYEVRHTRDGETYALKVLRELSHQRRFRREARLLRGLRHENIVQAVDAVEIEGHPALVMEYVAGPTLYDWLNLNERPSQALAERIFRELVAGVAHAHGEGVIHRDLKPENVLMTRGDQDASPRIADFGIAVDVKPSGTRMTAQGLAMGTPGYMAPEQIRNFKAADRRADLFALGCILYELLLDRAAFVGHDLANLYDAIRDNQYARPEKIQPDLPRRFVRVIKACLSPEPAQRPDDCAALLAILDRGSVDTLSADGALPRAQQIVLLSKLLKERRRARPSTQRTERIDRLVQQIRRPNSPQPQERFADTTLIKPIGSGNFATVWLADRGDGRQAATKIFNQDKLAEGVMIWRFRRGVRGMQKLTRLRDKHPGGRYVVRIFDPAPDDEALPADPLVFAMEYLSGGNLVDIQQRGWTLQKKLDVFEKVCLAVAFAHEENIIHRDIKPANIVLDHRHEPMLTDFDIADIKFLTRLSIGQANLGTPVFAAPEQLEDETRATEQSDIYSLGRLLYFLLLERSPGYQIEEDPELPTLSEYPRPLVDVVRRATQWDPARRYPNVEAMLADIERYQTGLAKLRSQIRRARRWTWQRRWILLVVGMLMVGLAYQNRVAENERALRVEIQSLNTQVLALQNAQSRLQGELFALRAQIDELEAAQDEIKKQKLTRKETIQALHDELSKLEKELEYATPEERPALEAQKARVDEELLRERLDAEQLELELNEITARIAHKQNEISEKEDELEDKTLESEVTIARLDTIAEHADRGLGSRTQTHYLSKLSPGQRGRALVSALRNNEPIDLSAPAVWRGCDLSGQDLRGVAFPALDLTGAVFLGANLQGADLSALALDGIDLVGAVYDDETKWPGEAPSGAIEARPRTDLRAVATSLRGANLLGADLQRSDLRGVDLSGARLDCASFEESIYDDATKWPGAPCPAAYRLAPRAALIDADLSNQDLSGVDLTGADLRGANLESSILKGTVLDHANLTGASLTGSNILDAQTISTIGL